MYTYTYVYVYVYIETSKHVDTARYRNMSTQPKMLEAAAARGSAGVFCASLLHLTPLGCYVCRHFVDLTQ